MKTQFVVYCDKPFHEGVEPIIRTFQVSSSPGSDQIGLHPLGRDANGNLIDVLLIDGLPVQRNFADERVGKLISQDRARIRHNFECECGVKVEILHEHFLVKVVERFSDGVLKISLTSLDG